MVLAIDQGTTNTKAILTDERGAVRASGSHRVGVHFPQAGWVQQDPEEVWSSVLRAVHRCLDAAGPVTVIGIALTNQRESVLAWDPRDLRPCSPIVGWQDHRTAGDRRLADDDLDRVVRERTGLQLDPMFSAPKMRWLRENTAVAGTVRLGTLDSWLVQRLTGGAVFAAEAGNASRTLIFDLHHLDWSADLAAVFELPIAALGEVRPSDAGFGRTHGLPVLPDGIPIRVVLADSHAAFYAHQVAAAGATKATYGTGTSVMSPAEAPGLPDDAGIASTLAWLDHRPQYAYEGNVLSSGAALSWTAKLLGLDDVADLEALARQASHSAGVIFVPALSGLGAPHWDRAATARLQGITAGTEPCHIARSAFEAVAHQVADVLAEIDRLRPDSVQSIRADGGGTVSSVLMQTQADLAGHPVQVADTAELSAAGAALMAWRTLGAEPAPAADPGGDFRPQLPVDERGCLRAAWSEAVRQARSDGDRR